MTQIYGTYCVIQLITPLVHKTLWYKWHNSHQIQVVFPLGELHEPSYWHPSRVNGDNKLMIYKYRTEQTGKNYLAFGKRPP